MGRSNSTQHKLDRVRPPRVHITYDVEVGDAIEMKELPFVVGRARRLHRPAGAAAAELEERKFVEVNPDNFDSGLEGMKPHLSFTVENKLSEDAGCAASEGRPPLQEHGRFRARECRPAGEALRELLDLRTRLPICAAACRVTTSSKNCCSTPSATLKSWTSSKGESEGSRVQ